MLQSLKLTSNPVRIASTVHPVLYQETKHMLLLHKIKKKIGITATNGTAYFSVV